jgi:hypothetical protein
MKSGTKWNFAQRQIIEGKLQKVKHNKIALYSVGYEEPNESDFQHAKHIL